VDEQILEVPPLELPPESETEPGLLRSAAAVELFVERARAAHAAFRIDDCGLGLVARICRQVDGLPLAIEMASAWAGSLGLELLDAKLGGSMNAWLRARSTAPHRHSTLQATLEWSHDLLSAPEQSVLRRLAVFAGSFSMQAAEAVAGDPAIPVGQVFGHVASLLRKSMITIVPGSRSQRYRLLETTRTFMLEKLENSDDAQPTRRRHARHVLQVLEQAKRELETTSDAVWLDCYGPLLDDLRSALTWATSDDFDEAVALAGVSWPFWRELSLRAEGRQWIGAVAARLKPGAPPALEAQLWRALSDTRMNAVPVKTALEEIERAVELYRMLDNRPELGCALTALANVLFMLGRNEEAEKTITEALAMLEPVGGPRTRAAAYSTQVYIEGALGRHDRARRAGEMAAHLATMAGAERVGLAVAVNLIEVSLGIGDIDWAISSARNLLARMEASPHTEIRGFVCGELAAALTFRGDLDEALAAARDAVPLLQSAGMLFWLFDHLALRTALVGRARDAGLVAGYADAAYRKFSRHREPIGERAVERTQLLLREALQADEIIQLAQLGAQLSEDQVLQLALNG
jgi:predicted ATPase